MDGVAVAALVSVGERGLGGSTYSRVSFGAKFVPASRELCCMAKVVV